MKVAQLWLTLRPHGLYSPWNSLGQNTGMGGLSLHQGIFPTQGSNPGLLHGRWILFQLRPQESPRILEWVAYPSSSKSSWSRNWTGVSCITGRFFTTWAIKEVQGFIIQEWMPWSHVSIRTKTKYLTYHSISFNTCGSLKRSCLSVVYLFVTWILPLEK